MFNKLISYLYHRMNPTYERTPVEKQVIVHTLSQEQLRSLRAKLPNAVITGSDSSEVAAHKLGVQCALLEIEKGFVV